MQVNEAVHYRNNEFLPEGYKVFHSSDQLGLSKKGYNAIGAINHDAQQLIICNAGTKLDLDNLDFLSVKDLFYDMRSNFQILKQKIPFQYKYALSFTKDIIELAPSSYNITITGYSLGAVLADLTGYTIAPTLFKPITVVTFENPGSLEIIQNNFDSSYHKEINTKVIFKVYNAGSPNIVNMFGEQIGRLYSVCLDESKFKPIIGNEYIEMLVEGHLFQNFMDGAFYPNGDIRFCDEYSFFS